MKSLFTIFFLFVSLGSAFAESCKNYERYTPFFTIDSHRFMKEKSWDQDKIIYGIDWSKFQQYGVIDVHTYWLFKDENQGCEDLDWYEGQLKLPVENVYVSNGKLFYFMKSKSFVSLLDLIKADQNLEIIVHQNKLYTKAMIGQKEIVIDYIYKAVVQGKLNTEIQEGYIRLLDGTSFYFNQPE